MMQFVDSKDSGLLILSHVYLLAGFALPLWLYPLRVYTNGNDIMYVRGLGLGQMFEYSGICCYLTILLKSLFEHSFLLRMSSHILKVI